MSDSLFTALRRLSSSSMDELFPLLAVMDPVHWPQTPDTVYVWARVATAAIEGRLATTPEAQTVLDKLQACGLMDQIWRLGAEGEASTLATPRGEDASPVLGRLFKNTLKVSAPLAVRDLVSKVPENAVWFAWVQRGLAATPAGEWEPQSGGAQRVGAAVVPGTGSGL